MVVHDCGENTPVTADQMVFQLVTTLGTVSDGLVAVVPAASSAWKVGAIASLSCVSRVAVFVPAAMSDWATASSWAAAPESFVVFGGSSNGASCEALDEDAA